MSKKRKPTQVANLKAELQHEQARSQEIYKLLTDTRAENREVRLDYVELGIAHARLKVELAQRDLELALVLGQNVIDELK